MNRIERLSRLSVTLVRPRAASPGSVFASVASVFAGLGLALGSAACSKAATPAPLDPTQVAGSNAAAMGKVRVPTFEELALKNEQIDRENALAAASVEEESEARATAADARRDRVEPTPDRSPESSVPHAHENQEDPSKPASASEATRAPDVPLPRNVTAMDQSEKRTDLRITQDIRRAVMADPSLSFAAKNVTVVTVRGHVVLKGMVKSAAERAAVSAKAVHVAGEGRVDARLLEVQK